MSSQDSLYSRSSSVTQTYKATRIQVAVVEQFGKPLVLREWDIPVAGTDQIVVRTEDCGVCHTDLHAANGDWPLKPKPPFIPGHEAIGIVCAVGADVTIVKEGDRVGVPWLYSACGHCEYCLSAEALDFAVRGKVKADIELQPISQINNIFQRLEHGSVAARVVLKFK